MHFPTVILFSLLVLFVHVNSQHAASLYPSSSEDIQDRPSSFVRQARLNRLQRLASGEEEDIIDHLWKSFSNHLLLDRARRRFGNTRYGRGLPND